MPLEFVQTNQNMQFEEYNNHTGLVSPLSYDQLLNRLIALGCSRNQIDELVDVGGKVVTRHSEIRRVIE